MSGLLEKTYPGYLCGCLEGQICIGIIGGEESCVYKVTSSTLTPVVFDHEMEASNDEISWVTILLWIVEVISLLTGIYSGVRFLYKKYRERKARFVRVEDVESPPLIDLNGESSHPPVRSLMDDL